MNSLFPELDVAEPTRPRTRKARVRSQYRRKAWEDHVAPQVYATDLADPPVPIPPMAAAVEVPVGTVLADLPDTDLDALIAAYRATRVEVLAARYAARVSLHLPGDPNPRPDYPASITAIARVYREEKLAEDGLRFLAKGVYPVRDPKTDPGTPWRSQPWVPAQPASPGRPAKPGRHINIVGRNKDGGKSTHIVSEAEAWEALARYYEEVEGIKVDVNPPRDSCMATLLNMLREACAAEGDACEAEQGED